MTRTRETIDRQSWLAMLDGMNSDVQESLREDLETWAGGRTCPLVSVTLDSTGRLDSQSAPEPEWPCPTAGD